MEQVDEKGKSPDKILFRISYSFLGMGCVILTGVIITVAILARSFSWTIKFSDYISMATFGCVTIGLVYNAISLRFNYEVNKLRIEKEEKVNERKKIKITYEAISEWYKGDMGMNAEIARRFMQPYKNKLDNPTELRSFKRALNSKENTNERRSLISVLNYFEHLSLLCCDLVINEEILKKAFRTAFVSYYTNLKGYITDEQSKNSGGNAKIFINFVTLSRKWLNE